MGATSKATILNVDDNEAGRYARTRTLQTAGFEVLEAGTGAEALQLAKARQPQLVLLDVNLPDMTGYEVCRRIKTSSQTARTLVLHVSATFVNGSDQKRGLEGGADGYLAEPVDQEVLIATVKAYLRLVATEEALRESEERFRAAFEGAPIGMALVNFDRRISRANQALSEMLGYAIDELSNRNVDELSMPEDQETEVTLLQQLLEGDIDNYRLEKRYASKNLDPVWVCLTGRAVRNSDGKIIHALVMVENVSERQEVEQERIRLLVAEQKARKEAENANRAKDQFLATVSHELRTPLGAILGWTRILRSQPNDDEITIRGLETIERNATAQAKLIEDILDVARIISGKLRLAAQAVDLTSVARAAVESVKPAVEAKNISLETELDGPGVLVTGDPSRLQQIVWNLLSNAVKFSSRGGSVKIQLERMDSDQVEVKVTDAGQGIPPEFLPHVFEPFQQADGSTTRQHGGLGLGLSIVRQLVELHGGTIAASSEGEGKGATFTVCLPALVRQASEEGRPSDARSKRSHSELPAKLPRVLEGVKVLAVDDEPDARELLAFVLQTGGAIVGLASSTSNALELLNSWQPDLIVADIGMPGEDGYTFIRKVRASSSRDVALVPALALTAYARVEERAQALAAGFQAHMTKPVEPAELIRGLARLLGESRTSAQGSSS